MTDGDAQRSNDAVRQGVVEQMEREDIAQARADWQEVLTSAAGRRVITDVLGWCDVLGESRGPKDEGRRQLGLKLMGEMDQVIPCISRELLLEHARSELAREELRRARVRTARGEEGATS